MQKILYTFIVLYFISVLSGCGFHLQGETSLAPPLKRMYLQTKDPYGYLARNLKESLKMSHVYLTAFPQNAATVLEILQDDSTQILLSVSGTTQTRQYELKVTVVFDITDKNGRQIVGPQTLVETRTITIQADQILGTSNEANLYFQQMRRSLANAIMNRIASKEITQLIMDNIVLNVDKKV